MLVARVHLIKVILTTSILITNAFRTKTIKHLLGLGLLKTCPIKLIFSCRAYTKKGTPQKRNALFCIVSVKPFLLSFFSNNLERNFNRNFLVEVNCSYVRTNFLYILHSDDLTIDVEALLTESFSNVESVN